MQSTYKKTTAHGHVYTETAAEYVLPDYQGDIKKVLVSEANIIPAGKFMSNAEAQFAGSVAYEILYADTEGTLTSAQFSSEYEFSVPVAEGAVDAIAEVTVNALSVRLCGPRRISVKGHVCAHVCSFVPETVETAGDALEPSLTPQLKETTLPVRYTVYAEGIERTYTETVAARECGEEHVQILSQGARCAVRGVSASEGEATLAVETCLYALVQTEGGVQCLRRTVSTEECVAVEGMRAGMKPTVWVASCVAHAMTETDAEGEESVRLDAQVSFGVRAEDNAPLSVVTDGYLCSEQTETAYGELSYETYVDTQTVTVSVEGESAAVEPADGALREILCASPTLKGLHAATDESGHLTVEGEVQIQAIGVQANAEGESTLCPIKATLPFSKTVDGTPAYARDGILEVSGTVVGADGMLDGDTVLLRGECHVSLRVLAPCSCRYVASMNRCGQAVSRDGSVITVYYPSASDTLWDIARTYRTTVKAIAEDNGLDAAACMADGAQIPVSRLLIL